MANRREKSRSSERFYFIGLCSGQSQGTATTGLDRLGVLGGQSRAQSPSLGPLQGVGSQVWDHIRTQPGVQWKGHSIQRTGPGTSPITQVLHRQRKVWLGQSAGTQAISTLVWKLFHLRVGLDAGNSVVSKKTPSALMSLLAQDKKPKAHTFPPASPLLLSSSC